MYNVMKKVIILYSIFFLSLASLHAQENTDLLLRFNQQDDKIRIVLESDKDFIKNANTVATLSAIKIEFPSQFELKKQKDFIFEIFQRDRFLSIKLKDVINVKVYKLSAPDRIVIDLISGQKIVKEATRNSESDSLQVTEYQKEWVIKQETDQFIEKTGGVKVLVLDPGHGGYDFGIVSKYAKEKNVNLKLAVELSKALSRMGKKVFFTREADHPVNILERIKLSNSKNPDVHISIHSSLSNRFVIYISTINDMNIDVAVKLYSLSLRQNRYIDKSREFSNNIRESIKSEFNMNVVMRELPLPILNSIDAPAILIEYPSVKFTSYDKKMREKFVNAILNGITAYEN